MESELDDQRTRVYDKTLDIASEQELRPHQAIALAVDLSFKEFTRHQDTALHRLVEAAEGVLNESTRSVFWHERLATLREASVGAKQAPSANDPSLRRLVEVIERYRVKHPCDQPNCSQLGEALAQAKEVLKHE